VAGAGALACHRAVAGGRQPGVPSSCMWAVRSAAERDRNVGQRGRALMERVEGRAFFIFFTLNDSFENA